MTRTKTTGKAQAKRARKKEPSLPKKPVNAITPKPEPVKQVWEKDPFEYVRSYALGISDIIEHVYALYIGGEGSMIRTVHTRNDEVIDVDIVFIPNTKPIDGQLRRQLR